MRERKHLILVELITWATGILTLAMVEEKQSSIFILPFLVTASFLSLVQQTSKSNC